MSNLGIQSGPICEEDKLVPFLWPLEHHHLTAERMAVYCGSAEINIIAIIIKEKAVKSPKNQG